MYHRVNARPCLLSSRSFLISHSRVKVLDQELTFDRSFGLSTRVFRTAALIPGAADGARAVVGLNYGAMNFKNLRRFRIANNKMKRIPTLMSLLRLYSSIKHKRKNLKPGLIVHTDRDYNL